MRTAIFLGAGAAAAEGAPLQAGLFRRYFENLRASDPQLHHAMDKELATFFRLMFDIDVHHNDLARVEFPTFEEALGVLDLAVARGEGLRDFDLVNMAGNSGRILAIRIYLVILLAKAIKDCLDESSGSDHLHLQMVENLKSASLLEEVIFITTNYDLLLDNAIIKHSHQKYDDPAPINYAIHFANNGDWPPPSPRATEVYKIHGSLNWLYCSSCNTIRYTPLEKGIVRLYNGDPDCACPECESVFEPLIIPPTFFKSMGNVFLTRIWHAAEQALRGVDQVIFCGYSFPDADLHIKYLLKRAQRRRSVGALKFKVINHYCMKPSSESQLEESRFRRFLGQQVKYTGMSFQDFAANPVAYMS